MHSIANPSYTNSTDTYVSNTYTDKEKNFINNIYSIDLLDLVKSEVLSFEFVLNYVLNENYQKTRKEKNITVQTVINYQPHLRDKFMSLLEKQVK
jgi:hypothetical protein